MTKTKKKVAKKSKYGSKKVEIDGIKFDSIMESEYYLYLKEELEAKRIKDFSLQPVFELQESYIVANNKSYIKSHEDFKAIKKEFKANTIRAIKYIADFLVTYNDDSKVVIDVKGQETPDFKIKRKMYDLKFPDLPLKLVQLRGRKPNKYWADYDELKIELREKKKAKAKADKEKKNSKVKKQ